ncbi:uncharacterized protein LOC127732132 [Mytilus californianus]|uniref:uncharacterized protein LOC127732132 n=1 Tax=Mytilus californianus TaxID=6549 RepID=UPI0022453630|nr:uncharacterized protein LOC127732132 [Mytilus californianus]
MNVPLLQVTRSKHFRQGTHGMLPVLQYSAEGKIIVKSIVKHQHNSMKEVIGLVHIQNTGISPAVYLIIETDDRYGIYMEMVSPGVTLEDVIKFIPDINPQISIKFVHYILHQLVKYINVIWDKRWSHKDLHAGNILIAESNQCVDIRITDFGNATEIDESTYEYISRDVIGIYDILSMLLKEHPEIDFGLKEYEKKRVEFLSKQKVMELMRTVTYLAEEFVKSHAANKDILQLISKCKADYVHHRNNQTRTGEDENSNVRRCLSFICGMDCVNL